MEVLKARCRDCRHFSDSPEVLEGSMPGLASLSSAYAAVRSEDGLCTLHERYLTADSHCARFERRIQGSRRSTSTRQS